MENGLSSKLLRKILFAGAGFQVASNMEPMAQKEFNLLFGAIHNICQIKKSGADRRSVTRKQGIEIKRQSQNMITLACLL